MEVTDIRIRKINPNTAQDSKMRAIVSVTFDNELVVHDIKIIQGVEKLFIAMPSRKVEDGTYKDIAHPIKSSFRVKLHDAVMEKYHNALADSDAEQILSKGSDDNAEKESDETI